MVPPTQTRKTRRTGETRVKKAVISRFVHRGSGGARGLESISRFKEEPAPSLHKRGIRVKGLVEGLGVRVLRNSMVGRNGCRGLAAKEFGNEHKKRKIEKEQRLRSYRLT